MYSLGVYTCCLRLANNQTCRLTCVENSGGSTFELLRFLCLYLRIEFVNPGGVGLFLDSSKFAPTFNKYNGLLVHTIRVGVLCHRI